MVAFSIYNKPFKSLDSLSGQVYLTRVLGGQIHKVFEEEKGTQKGKEQFTHKYAQWTTKHT